MGNSRRVLLTSLAGAIVLNGGCLTPTDEIRVVGKQLATTAESCTNGSNTATIEPAGERSVRIEGEFVTSHACDTLVASAYTSKSSEKVIVEIESHTPETSDCRDCTSTRAFRANFEFSRRPTEVHVEYVVGGETVGTIASRSLDE